MQQDDQWFYIPAWPVHNMSDLVYTYQTSLGRNANWYAQRSYQTCCSNDAINFACRCRLLDIAPAPNSSVASTHMAQYQNLGNWIRSCYGSPIAQAAMAPQSTVLNIVVPAGKSVDRIQLLEDQTNGQIVHVYTVSGLGSSGWQLLSNGTSIGAQQIDIWTNPGNLTQVRVTTDSAPTGLVASLFLCQDPTN
jgi:alpha-L-fucosidase